MRSPYLSANNLVHRISLHLNFSAHKKSKNGTMTCTYPSTEFNYQLKANLVSMYLSYLIPFPLPQIIYKEMPKFLYYLQIF